MKVACLQMRSSNVLEENISAFRQMVGEAANRGAAYIQSPEMTALLDKNRKSLLENTQPDTNHTNQNKFLRIAGELAKQHHIWLHVGSIAVKLGNGMLANRSVVFSPDGNRIASYDKLHMFDVDLPNGETWRESSTYQPGTEAIIVNTGKFSLGMSICYDLRFPDLYRTLAKHGAGILTCPAAFTAQTGKAHWNVLLRSRAIENGAFMIAAAHGGKHQDGRETWGHSMVVNPWGEVLAELDHHDPGVLMCDIDLTQITEARDRIPVLENKTAYQLVTINQEQNW